MGCLYRINFPNGKAYIGATMYTAEERFAEHVYNARRGLNRGINRALRKYGHEAVKLETLVIADRWDYLADLERRAIAAFGTKGAGGYNMTDGGEGALGYRHTPESLKKMGETHVGNKNRLGIKHTEESKRKMSASRLGKKLSESAKANVVAALRRHSYVPEVGSKLSDDVKAKMRVSQRGKGKGASSGHVGVTKRGDKWAANITHHNKYIHLGLFCKLDDAINARKLAEANYWGIT